MGSSRERKTKVFETESLDAREHDESRDSSTRASGTGLSHESPATRVIRQYERLNALLGHENAGFLSFADGFMPRAPPLQRFHPNFQPWDELVERLPVLYRDQTLREQVERLPVLDASEASLDASEALRACTVLAILGHAYWYVEPTPPKHLPESIRRPWAQVRRRLKRHAEVLSYLDLIIYNFRLRDAQRKERFVLENMDLLCPTIGNREERVFYLTQVEILARATPVVRLAGAAHDAVLQGCDDALEAALVGVFECLEQIVKRALLKIDPNPYGKHHVNPVVWAKTVAPFAVPFHPNIQGPSGTSSPIFNVLDLFFGRTDFQSFLGREIKQLRETYPPAWQSYLRALSQVSVAEYVERTDNRNVRSAFREAFEIYASENGFLGRHRMKVYGYLELAFKVGRAVTIGGFGGTFTDRTWDAVDNELIASQLERLKRLPSTVHRAKVLDVQPSPEAGTPLVRRVVLDVKDVGVRYKPGDRCLILPENTPAIIERTLAALHATGDELVALTDEWKALERSRPELAGRAALPIREVLRFGSIRPVSPRLAEALHARTQSPSLLRQIVDGCTERWELWELLQVLEADGFDPRSLWSEPGVKQSERLCRLIPPLRFRVYSISSAYRDPSGAPRHVIELTVGQLRYRAEGAGDTEPASDPSTMRYGTASTFLVHARESGREVPFIVERPDRFFLPEDPRTPIVLFAGGTGISPFRAFLDERTRMADAGKSWLFLSLRAPEDFLYGDELAAAVAQGALELFVAFTRVGATVVRDAEGRLVTEPGPTRRIDDLMLEPNIAGRLWHLLLSKEEGGEGAHVYVCGRSGFADRVLRTLKAVFRRYAPEGNDEARVNELLYRLVGEQRLVQEIHTDTRPSEEDPRRFDMSEIAEHNNAERGYWLVIDRVVYDLTEFIELHPGGRRIVQAYAGMDATHGFARAHYQRADVDAMREPYRIGVVRALHFDDYAVCVQGPAGPITVDCAAVHRSLVNALQLVVEMQNALAADHSLQEEQLGPYEQADERTAYKLSRAVETHRRFTVEYWSVLTRDTLPGLWRLCQGLLFPEQDPEWMKAYVKQVQASEHARRNRALVERISEEFSAWKDDARMPSVVEVLERTDAWFLSAIKAALIDGLREFERHGPSVRELGASRVLDAYHRAADVLCEYHERLALGLTQAVDSGPPQSFAPLPSERPASAVQRLHSGRYWTFEEEPGRGLAVLRRTPLPVASLEELIAENEVVLRCLRGAHRDFGLVVDTRQAPMRNDVAFENAMARLRSVLTSHFRRTAVLLETNLGELQVNRLERDERRYSLVTRSESSAYKFALGRG